MDAADYCPRSVQEHIGVLFQDYAAYSLTAGENIGVGRLDRMGDLSEIRRAARRSGADGVVDDLPKQYDTILGRIFEGGVQLSGGEWQKVALARAFVNGRKLLLLDEPFEGVSVALSRRLSQTIREFQHTEQGVSVLIAESDLKRAAMLTRHAYVIERGEVIEEVSLNA